MHHGECPRWVDYCLYDGAAFGWKQTFAKGNLSCSQRFWSGSNQGEMPELEDCCENLQLEVEWKPELWLIGCLASRSRR